MKAGDVVSIYSDIKGKCKKGAKEFDGTKIFLGNGISELSRREIFSGLPELKNSVDSSIIPKLTADGDVLKAMDTLVLVGVIRRRGSNGHQNLKRCVGSRGIGVRMTEPVYLSPSFDNVLPSYLFLQNLPSAVVAHVLNPQPGERTLDLCAAPGGKTTHIAALMQDQGEVIALDKISNKVEKIKQNALLLGLNSIRAFCFDGTKALKLDVVKDTEVFKDYILEI
ncbi:putative methyltransferase NSUN6 [Camelus dromedarius]|uniref:Putative methyltransferase NSUN6 n=1 Tax=Camelus dromedarius TaxID=9838 RepID=A0A5N4C574_CAMDR|nr:putative methyltransferase NSUN6 [Camelus dromedarius]